MVTVALAPLKVVGNLHGARLQTIDGYKEANSQVFKRGELVTLVDNEVTRVAAGGLVGAGNELLDVSDHVYATTGATTTEPQIFGVALKDATNVTSGNIVIPVMLFGSGYILEGNIVEGTNGDAPTNHTAVVGDIGHGAAGATQGVALLFDDTNDRWYFSFGGTAEIVGYVLKYAGNAGEARTGGGLADVNARGQVIINAPITLMN